MNDRFYFDKQNNFYGFYTYAFNYIYIILNKKNLYEFLFQANLLNLIATFSIIYLCTSAILKEILNKKNTFSIFLTFLILITLPQIVRVGEGLYDFATACIGLYSIFLLQHLNFKIFKEKFIFVIFFCLAVISKFINIFLSPFLIAYVLFFKFYEFRLIKNYSLILIPITIFGIFVYQSIYFHNTFFYPITADFPDFYNQINFERNSLQEQNLFKTTIISLEKIFINEVESNGNLLSLIFLFNFIIFFLSQKKNQINFIFLGSISFFITFVLYNFGNYIINRYFLLFSISQYIIFVANLFYLKTNKKLCNFFLILIILFNISYLYPKDLSKFNLFKNQSIFNYSSLKNFFFEGYLKSWICVYDIKEKNMPDKKYITDGSYNFFTKIDDYYLLGYQNEIVRNKNFNEIKKDIKKYQNFAIFHKNKISTSDEKFYEYLESIFNYKVEINQFLIYSKKSLSKDVKSCNL